MAHGTFDVGEILTAANLNAHTIPNDAIAIGTKAGSQNIADSAVVDVNAASTLDPLGWYANLTGIFTPDIAGWYFFHAEVHWSSDADYDRIVHILSKNDSSVTHHLDVGGSAFTAAPDFTLSAFFQMNGTTDNLRLKVQQINTDATTEAVTAGTQMVLRLVYPT